MNTKEGLINIGKILVQENGKQKFYTPEQVEKAHEKIKVNNLEITFESIELLDLAVSLYSPAEDFVRHFSSNTVEYLKLKNQAIKELSESDWDLPTIDIDMSWLDIGDVFEGILEGVGSFF